MPADDVTARLRATGTGAFRTALNGAATSVRGLGSAGRAGAVGLGRIDRAASQATVSMRSIAGAAAGYAVASKIRDAVVAGFQYNRMIDGQNVAFTTLLGSQQRAADFMGQIQALALESPVLDPQTTGDAARLLMAYGLSVKSTLPFVKALGDMSAATGKSIAESMPRGAMALGQIASKGKLQTEELNQLAESVGLSRKAIRRELDMTADEFEATFKPGKGIKAERALPAILRAMEKQSGGAAERLSKTTGGKLDRLREVFRRKMGALTRPIWDATGDVAGAMASILQDDDMDFAERFEALRRVVKREIDPLAADFKTWWRDEHVGETISAQIEASAPGVGRAFGNAIEAAAPVAMDAAAAVAPRAAGAFVSAFKSASPWAQVLTVGLLASKLGVFSTLGRMAAGRMCGSITSRLPGCIEGGMKGKAGQAGFARVATALAGSLAVSLPAALIAAGLAGVVMAALLPEGREGKSAESGNPEDVRAHHVIRPGEGRTGAEIAANRDPELDPGPTRRGRQFGPDPIITLPRQAVRPAARATGVTPPRPGSILRVESTVKVGQRELGRATRDVAVGDLARKGARRGG